MGSMLMLIIVISGTEITQEFRTYFCWVVSEYPKQEQMVSANYRKFLYSRHLTPVDALGGSLLYPELVPHNGKGKTMT